MPYEPPTLQDRADPSDSADELVAQALPMVADAGIAGDETADDMLGESPPEHGWLGHGFVWGLYTLVPIQLFAGIYLLTTGWKYGGAIGMLPLILFIPALNLWLARSVQTFRLHGWGVAMLMLLFAAFSTLRLLLGNPDGIQILAALATGALEIAWIRYFWGRRPDFT
ncbi:MAG TPA: hypothetical protein VE871_18420 [Longimicrobium sp.]|nr:hypothetical protein [Longimicrobium sp.]